MVPKEGMRAQSAKQVCNADVPEKGRTNHGLTILTAEPFSNSVRSQDTKSGTALVHKSNSEVHFGRQPMLTVGPAGVLVGQSNFRISGFRELGFRVRGVSGSVTSIVSFGSRAWAATHHHLHRLGSGARAATHSHLHGLGSGSGTGAGTGRLGSNISYYAASAKTRAAES